MKMEKAVNLLKGALGIYSTSGKESEVSKYLVSEMKKLGFKSHVDGAGNAVGEIGIGKKTILMVGHIDTVSGFIDVKVDGNRLYGRGSVDAKGPFCSFLMAASLAKLSDAKVICIGAVEEECATSKGARFLIGKYKPDYILIGEPSGYDAVTLGYKGRLLVDYEITKDISHTASNNISAVEEAINFYVALRNKAEEFNKAKERIFDKVQISARHINTENNGFSEIVKMKIGYRLPVGFDTKGLRTCINSIRGDASVDVYGEEVAIEAGKNNSLVRSFLKSMRQNDITPKFKIKTGTSDMNVLGHAYPEVPIVTYGPGDSSLDHTPEEHIMIDEYKKAIEVLKSVLENLVNYIN
jgi:LysW-gamma-L-lysine carboxypeptidase